MVSVAVSLMTKPREYGELKGLVWSLTPKESFQDEHRRRCRGTRTSNKLAGLALAMVIVLNFIFA